MPSSQASRLTFATSFISEIHNNLLFLTDYISSLITFSVSEKKHWSPCRFSASGIPSISFTAWNSRALFFHTPMSPLEKFLTHAQFIERWWADVCYLTLWWTVWFWRREECNVSLRKWAKRTQQHITEQTMKREDQQDATIRCLLLTSVSTCFGASLCPSSGEQISCYCIRCTALVLLDVVDSGCGALRCRMRALLASYNAAPHNRYQPHPAEPEQYTKCSNWAFVLLKMGKMMPETCSDRS